MNFGLGIWWWGAKYFQNPRGILGVFFKRIEAKLEASGTKLKGFPSADEPQMNLGLGFDGFKEFKET